MADVKTSAIPHVSSPSLSDFLTGVTSAAPQTFKSSLSEILTQMLAGSTIGSLVQNQVNAGTAAGTMYYLNLGGIKILWAVSNSGLTTGTSWGFTLPSSFFTTIQYVGSTAVAPSGSAFTFSNVATVSTSAVSCFLEASSGSGTSEVSILVIGT